MDAEDKSQEREIEEIFPVLYDELRKLARHRMAGEPSGHTLQATALVHEAYLRLAKEGDQRWKSRRYFFAAAAQAMRRILIDRARAKSAERRGAGALHLDIDELEIVSVIPEGSLLDLDAALANLEKVDPEKAELVKLKFFGGLTTEEAARLLDISEPTGKRYWAFARAWIAREMRRQQS